MKQRDTFTLISFFISILSLAIAIVSGFSGARFASNVSLWVIVVTWVIWVTIKIIRFDNLILPEQSEQEKRYTGNVDKDLIPKLPDLTLFPCQPRNEFQERILRNGTN